MAGKWTGIACESLGARTARADGNDPQLVVAELLTKLALQLPPADWPSVASISIDLSLTELVESDPDIAAEMIRHVKQIC